MPQVVITYGTFDLFHIGHLNLLRRAKELGDKLIVGVSTDEFNLGKGKKTIIRFEDRLEIIQALRCVYNAIPETSWDQKIRDIQEYGVNTFVMGDDWRGKFDFLQEYCKVVYLPRTEDVSSTDLKLALRNLGMSHIQELKKALDIISTIIVPFE